MTGSAYGHAKTCECDLCTGDTSEPGAEESEESGESGDLDYGELRENEAHLFEEIRELKNIVGEFEEKSIWISQLKAEIEQLKLVIRALENRCAALERTHSTDISEEPADENDYPNPPLPKG